TAVVRSQVPVRWMGMRYPSVRRAVTKTVTLRPNRPAVREVTEVLPATTPPSQPYWLREEGTPGLLRVDDATLIGRPENPPVFPVEDGFEVGKQPLVLSGEPMATDPGNAGARRRLEVIAPVSLHFVSGVELWAPGDARPVTVEVTAARAGVAGTVQLGGPADWKVAPASQPFRLAGIGDHTRVTFTVTAPSRLVTARLGASAMV